MSLAGRYACQMTKRFALLLAVLPLLVLQGCVIPAAIHALHHWDTTVVVTARQMDATHFRVVVGIEHSRGDFDVLGSHGSHTVLRSVDLELWQLSITDQGIKMHKEDAITLDADGRLWYWGDDMKHNMELDMVRGRISLKGTVTEGKETVIENRLNVNSYGEKVSGRIHGQTCAATLPNLPTVSNTTRWFAINEANDYIIVTDFFGNKSKTTVLIDACNPSTPRHQIPDAMDWITDFSIGTDGLPQVIQGRRRIPTAEKHGDWRYEVQIFPGPEKLTFAEDDLGNHMLIRGPYRAFMFDAPLRRFHWVIKPVHDGEPFEFITHDFANGRTEKRPFYFKETPG